MKTLIRYAVWATVAVLGSAVLVVNLYSDRWWFATVLLFSPRWLLLLPVIVFVPLAAWSDRRLLIPLMAAFLVLVGPFMGLEWTFVRPPGGQAAVVRAVTCNVHEGRFDATRFATLLTDTAADLVALQECPQELELPLPRGWHGCRQRGLAVFSRFPVRCVGTVQVRQPNEQWPGTHLLHAEVTTPWGPLAFCSLHLPSPRFGLQAVLDRHTLLRPSRKGLLEQQTRARWLAATEVKKYLDGLDIPLLVVGDFNTPQESRLYGAVWGGYANAFATTGRGYGWTQRVQVKGLPFGARIDHVLAGAGLTPLMCELGPDLGSDHLPLIADIAVSRTSKTQRASF